MKTIVLMSAAALALAGPALARPSADAELSPPQAQTTDPSAAPAEEPMMSMSPEACAKIHAKMHADMSGHPHHSGKVPEDARPNDRAR